MKYSSLFVATLSGSLWVTCWLQLGVQAQPIVPSGSTGTVVTGAPNSPQWLIQGGTEADKNLFHQFQRFGLRSGQSATFQANPQIRNIFSRISGGQASLINGLLRVQGAKANLFLINPAGVIFGRDARLDLTGNFTATTADALQFANGRWFQDGPNQYGDFTGHVTGYAWLNPTPASVINAGNLGVQPGRSILLAGGSVVNTGTITAPGGQVSIVAVPGENILRVSQANQVLSLDLPIAKPGTTAQNRPVPTSDIPKLLAGSDATEATGIQLIDGQIKLNSSRATINLQPNQAIISGKVTVNSHEANSGAATSPTPSRIDITGERIDLQAAHIDASGQNGGGQIRIGGDFQGQGSFPTAQQVTVDTASQLNVDAATQGNGGRVIIWSDGLMQFAGTASARGGMQNGNGGLVETSGQILQIAPTAQVSTAAAQGKIGRWLLDPTELDIIAAGGAAGIVSGTNDPTTASTIDRPTLETALNGNNVTLQATSLIRVNTPIDTSGNVGAGNLQLDAPTLNLNQPIQLNGNLSGTATTVNVATTGRIQNAVDAVATSGTVNLVSGTYRDQQQVTINRSLTLQGQGAANTTVSGDLNADTVGDHRVFQVAATANNVTIRDLTIADGAVLNNNGGGLQNLAQTLSIENVAFLRNQTTGIGSHDGGAIDNRNNGTAIINNSQFNNNQAVDDGGAINVGSGSITINNSVFFQNQAASTAGAIDIDASGTLIGNNLNINTNSATDSGGAIASTGSLTLTGGNVSSNTAGITGGGIQLEGQSQTSIDNVFFSQNQAANFGGAINYQGNALSQLNINGSSFSNNRVTSLNNAFGDGGALFLDTPGATTIASSSFLDNVASFDGGAIAAQGASSLILNSVVIQRNQAQRDNGGGIFLRNDATLQMNGSVVADNTASFDGGGLFLFEQSRTSITGSTLRNNVATNRRGGAIASYSSNLNALELNNTVLEANQARRDGGAIWTQGNLTAANLSIQNNQSGSFGGAIVLQGNAVVNLDQVGFVNNQTGSAGGAISMSGTSTLNLTDSRFQNNQSSGYAGAINTNTGNTGLTIRGTTFENNQAQLEGGAIYAEINTLIEDSTFTNNRAVNEGGAIVNERNTAQLTLRRTTFTNNNATNFGGAIKNFDQGRITIEASNFDGNTAAQGGAIHNRATGQAINIRDTDFTSNQATQSGGAIDNQSTLTITGATFDRNAATDQGGAIRSLDGNTTITQTDLTANSAQDGGALFQAQGNLNVTGSNFLNNQAQQFGGGVLLSNIPNALIQQSVIQGNQAMSGGGGGIDVQNTTNLDLQRVTLRQNQADGNGGAISARQFQNFSGSINIADSTIDDNQSNSLGGGIHFDPVGSGSPLTITRSTISHNRADRVGGLSLSPGGFGTLTNVTLSGNQANQDGGAIRNRGDLTITSSTIVNNQADLDGSNDGQGGGIFQDGNPLFLSNTIVANNQAAIGADIAGEIIDQGNNLIGIGDGSAGFNTSTFVGTAATPLNPLLAPLNDYGGLTQTVALLPGSPAIDAGNSALSTDQRGVNRVNNPDIGAFESRGFNLTVQSGGGQSTSVNTAFLNPLVMTVNSPFGEPISGGQIQFTAPSTGASATLTSNPIELNLTGSTVQLPIAANNIAGSYTLTAQTNGAAPIAIGLTNTPTPPPTVAAPPPTVAAPTPPTAPPTLPIEPGANNNINSGQLRSIVPAESLTNLDADFSQDYAQVFGSMAPSQPVSGEQVQTMLTDLDEARGIRSAVIYAMFVPEAFTPKTQSQSSDASPIPTLLRATEKRDSDRLELIFITAQGQLTRYSTPYRRQEVQQQMQFFWMRNNDVADQQSFAQFGQQFHAWLFKPIQKQIQSAKVNSLIYVLDDGLRLLPVASMQTPTGALLEDYTVSVIPSLGMLDRRRTILKNQTTMAMGADRFEQLTPLPAVPSELKMIQQQGFSTTSFLNEQFTIDNMVQQKQQIRPGILHLATHADFNTRDPKNSFIQFWNERLTIDQIDRLKLRNSGLELIILSACNTATGDPVSELGFTGMASLFGVRSAIGSLWSVSDMGTFAFMSEFYGQLAVTPSRADALRKTQLAMRQGTVRVENGQLITSRKTFDLPATLRAQIKPGTFTHPYYWSGFTLVGNPW